MRWEDRGLEHPGPAFLSGLVLRDGDVAGLGGGAMPAFRGLTGGKRSAHRVRRLRWFVGPVVRWIWEPISNPGEHYSRSENLNDVLVLSAIFCATLPLVVLASYLNAEAGERQRDRVVTRTVS